MPATLRMVDLSPRFLKFYELAESADPETRWRLWLEHYNIAAVPPTEEGRALARSLLEQNWHRYPEVMDRIRQGAAGFRPDPQQALDATAQALGFDQDLSILFVAFVGMLDRNAWAASMGEHTAVHFPIESFSEEEASVFLPHEFAHVLHDRLSGFPGGWLKSVATLLMQEGMAIWTSRAVAPGREEWHYLTLDGPAWVERCREREKQIFQGVLARLQEVSADALQTFTTRTGPAGLEREGYWAGYRAVGHLLDSGFTLAQLARMPEGEYTTRLEAALQVLTTSHACPNVTFKGDDGEE
ncbi:hypothetical protein J2Z79_001908 [Symbiobacterium terraclitae]|uniref:Peptidase MA-like domain-containing protein n=1 Tax=Symbiobacterium terraclitae TaxID=557451 RepID=A0ABS4JSI8_9FIRM|nr:hypothetical protein [Symbiobacterium terraclitae]MBP2018497.1 hypothetical protein [Symbiobacterium terraclitae]